MRRRSRIKWAAEVVAPWCLGLAVLFMIAPDAGQSAPVGGSFTPMAERAGAMPGAIVPIDAVTLDASLFRGLNAIGDRLLVQASYAPGTSADFKAVPAEVEPRRDLKPGVGATPAIDRTNKGEPSLGLRPTFDTRLRRPGGLQGLRESLMIAPHDDAMPAGGFSLRDGDPLDGATAFSPWAEGESPEDAADLTPRGAGTAIVMQPAALKERLAQGATPKVSRAEALASTTPVPADGAPVEASFVVPMTPRPADTTAVARAGHPNYAALLTGDKGAHERKCLAEAVYFEARSEPEEGQAAVAQVVLNRAASGLYPASVCGVVYQNRSHFKACQFSFACEGKALRVTEPEAWRAAVRVADAVVEGKTYLSDVGTATHYHAKYVRPGWARRLVKMDVIGHHIFYKLRPGQT